MVPRNMHASHSGVERATLPATLSLHPSEEGSFRRTHRALRLDADDSRPDIVRMAHFEDAQLAERIRSGDVAAFEQLFHAEYPGIVMYLTRTIGAAWDAEELAQAVFVRLWEQRMTFAPHTTVRAYLYGAARHAALNHFRASRRPMPPNLAGHSSAAPAIDIALEQRDLLNAVQRAVDQLPARAREIWVLHRDQGLTVPEIAATLGISVNTVKTQLARSFAALRQAAAPFLALILVARR